MRSKSPFLKLFSKNQERKVVPVTQMTVVAILFYGNMWNVMRFIEKASYIVRYKEATLFIKLMFIVLRPP